MSIADRIISWACEREPDFVIGGQERPYLLRWWLIPRNRFFNVYVHRFLRSDDDRALHDHPWANASYILEGQYTEHEIAQGGGSPEKRARRRPMAGALDREDRASRRVDARSLLDAVFHRPALPRMGFPLPGARLDRLEALHCGRGYRCSREGV